MNSNEEIPSLPALRSLGNLADLRPTVIIDSREQCPLPIRRLPAVRGTLQSGDYGLLGSEDFAIERKSISDLVGCVTGGRERFEREMRRLRGLKFKRLLIIGYRAEVEMGQYRSRVSPKAVLHSLDAWEQRFDLPIVWADTQEDGAALVEKWCYWHAREIVESANAILREQRKVERNHNDCISEKRQRVANAEGRA